MPTDAELKCLWLPDLPVYVKGVTRSFLVLASLLACYVSSTGIVLSIWLLLWFGFWFAAV